jgi:hypothetical protein
VILDANGGNQTMWLYKDCKNIVHIDMEKKLTVKPLIFCDNRHTPFLDATFATIFIDPPHFFNDTSSFFAIPDKETFMKKWQGYGEIPRYYGGDKYKTQTELIHYVFDLQKECNRILTDDGLLWLKWNETYITVNTIMHLFDNWHELLRIPVRLSNPNRTEKQTFWVCLCKQEKKLAQTELTFY